MKKESSTKNTTLSPLKAIRNNCRECSGNQPSMVKYCQITTCQFWHLRFGRRPKTILAKGGTREADLFNPENFEEEGKYGPDKDISSLKAPEAHCSSKKGLRRRCLLENGRSRGVGKALRIE